MKRPAKSSKNMTMEKAPTAQLLPFEPTALLDGEDAAAQDELLMRVSGSVKPFDFFEARAAM